MVRAVFISISFGEVVIQTAAEDEKADWKNGKNAGDEKWFPNSLRQSELFQVRWVCSQPRARARDTPIGTV